VRWNDIVWTYEQPMRRHAVPRESDKHGLVIADRFGWKITVVDRVNIAFRTLTAIVERVPWVVTANTETTRHLWKHDRMGMILHVDQRRTEHRQRQPDAAA
jgi:hypothetical protein